MKILKLFGLIAVFLQISNLNAYSYGVDSYFKDPIYLKLHFRSSSDSNPIYVPAGARGQSLVSYKGKSCITAVEMLDKDQKSIDVLRVGKNKISRFLNNEIFPYHSETAWNDILCGNRNFVIDKHGRLGIWGGCHPIDKIPGWACVDISNNTANVLGKSPYYKG